MGDGSDPLDDWPCRIRKMTEDEKVYQCIRLEDPVREALSGFVVHAPSEWDSSLNESRYHDVNEPGGFFAERKESQPDGFKHFMTFLKRQQWVEQSGFAAGQKFWFFHPLKFIRHFRRCGWLSVEELASLLPNSAVRYVKPHGQPGQWASEPVFSIPARTPF